MDQLDLGGYSLCHKKWRRAHSPRQDFPGHNNSHQSAKIHADIGDPGVVKFSSLIRGGGRKSPPPQKNNNNQKYFQLLGPILMELDQMVGSRFKIRVFPIDSDL